MKNGRTDWTTNTFTISYRSTKYFAQEVQQLNNALDSKRSMYTKLQGVREYLEQTGVELPKEEPEAPAEAVEPEVAEK